MSQKLPVDGFGWRKDLFRFNEEFIQKHDETVTNDTYFKLIIDYSKELQKIWKI